MGSEQKYKQLGADYHWQWAAQGSGNPYVQWVKRVTNTLPQGGNGLSVMDVGCGDGYPASLLVERGYTVIGLDVIPDALRVAVARVPAATFVLLPPLGDGVMPDGTHEYVLALDSLEHMDDPALLVQAVQLCTVYALVSCPAPGLDPHAVRDYTTDDLHALFAGCTVETLIDEGEHRLFKVTPERKDAANEDRDRGQSTSTPERADDERPQRQPQRSRAWSARKGA